MILSPSLHALVVWISIAWSGVPWNQRTSFALPSRGTMATCAGTAGS
jgi:hypothetical protein